MQDLLGNDKSTEDDNYDLLDEPSSGKNIFFIGFAVIILAAFGFIFYHFVLQGDGNVKRNPTPQANVPLLLPEVALKEIPQDAGGLEIPNQDQQVFEVIENPTPPETATVEEEAATPPPETSEEATSETEAETTETTQNEDVNQTNLLPLPEEPQLESQVESQAVEPIVEPEAVAEAETPPETTEEASDKLRIEFLESESVEEPQPIAGGLQIQIPDEPVAEPTPPEATPEPAPETNEEVVETTPEDPPETEATTEPEAEAPKISSGDYIVQLAALDNLQSAELSRMSFIEQFPDLLLADRLVVQEGILSDGAAIFRVQVKALDVEDARMLCVAIKAQGRDCFIKRAP